MLHLIFQATIDKSIFSRIASGDDVVFLENAVFTINKRGLLAKQLEVMLQNHINLFVLNRELESRGIVENELVAGIIGIEYSDLVKLTEKNKTSCTWN